MKVFKITSTSKKSAKFRRCEVIAEQITCLVSVLKLTGNVTALNDILEKVSESALGEPISFTVDGTVKLEEGSEIIESPVDSEDSDFSKEEI